MKILAIDPSSNKIETSTTGIVLLDNAALAFYTAPVRRESRARQQFLVVSTRSPEDEKEGSVPLLR